MIRAARSLLQASANVSGRPAGVVNVSSVAAISGENSSVAYSASKGAPNAMTLPLARALAPYIRVNTVCPDDIDTPWFTQSRGEAGARRVRDAVLARASLKVVSTDEDVAQLVCFLASPASSGMTGECMRIDARSDLVRMRSRAMTCASLSCCNSGAYPGDQVVQMNSRHQWPR